MTFFLCEDHSVTYRAIDRQRKVINVLLILSVVILVVWEPLAMGMSCVAYRESRIGGVTIALMLAVVPAVFRHLHDFQGRGNSAGCLQRI